MKGKPCRKNPTYQDVVSKSTAVEVIAEVNQRTIDGWVIAGEVFFGNGMFHQVLKKRGADLTYYECRRIKDYELTETERLTAKYRESYHHCPCCGNYIKFQPNILANNTTSSHFHLWCLECGTSIRWCDAYPWPSVEHWDIPMSASRKYLDMNWHSLLCSRCG